MSGSCQIDENSLRQIFLQSGKQRGWFLPINAQLLEQVINSEPIPVDEINNDENLDPKSIGSFRQSYRDSIHHSPVSRSPVFTNQHSGYRHSQDPRHSLEKTEHLQNSSSRSSRSVLSPVTNERTSLRKSERHSPFLPSEISTTGHMRKNSEDFDQSNWKLGIDMECDEEDVGDNQQLKAWKREQFLSRLKTERTREQRASETAFFPNHSPLPPPGPAAQSLKNLNILFGSNFHSPEKEVSPLLSSAVPCSSIQTTDQPMDVEMDCDVSQSFHAEPNVYDEDRQRLHQQDEVEYDQKENDQHHEVNEDDEEEEDDDEINYEDLEDSYEEGEEPPPQLSQQQLEVEEEEEEEKDPKQLLQQSVQFQHRSSLPLSRSVVEGLHDASVRHSVSTPYDFRLRQQKQDEQEQLQEYEQEEEEEEQEDERQLVLRQLFNLNRGINLANSFSSQS
eukprot:TRINITY_DN8524_c0_g1_i1.p1 TRINITY_DN8524_c0_g1~~TRINITY_DN8524_c0_g1_i1.p1  ORF type:complete len:448 (-),score=142.65 TRINITY_DN8524_c0_g1_i1:115-1458(-)